jgi:hypothetical protein
MFNRRPSFLPGMRDKIFLIALASENPSDNPKMSLFLQVASGRADGVGRPGVYR